MIIRREKNHCFRIVLALALGLGLGACTGTVSGSDAGPEPDGQIDAGADPGGDPGADPGADPGSDPGSDPGADPGPDGGDGTQPQEACPALGAATGNIIEVGPGQADSLRQIVRDAPAGSTIVLADGTYHMDGGDDSHRLSFSKTGVTLRSASGDPSAVILDGDYVTGELISINADDVTIAELTLTRAYYHPVHVSGGSEGDTTGTRLYRLRIIDPGEQAVKINPSYGGTFVDQGRVECCHIELTDAGRPHIRNNCYTGGVDAHQAMGWVVRLNHIQGFWCPQGLSEHGIHFWVCCRDTLVERNTIVNCARGIGFGLGENGNGNERVYPDDPYPEIGYIGHYDGVIRNNFVFSSIAGFDAGITLEQAHGTQVAHNTVVSIEEPFSSIEWRFDNTAVDLINNLVSHNLRDRGGQADLDGNLEQAPAGLFVSHGEGNLHLVPGAAQCIDQGVALPAGLADEDIDGQTRDSSPDIGADEYLP